VRPCVVSHLNAKATQFAMGGNLLLPGEISQFKHDCGSPNQVQFVCGVSQLSATNHSLFSKSPNFVQRDNNGEDGNTIGPSEINGISIDPMLGWVLTYFLNFSGHPAASVPAGLTTDNLPVGMQIIGKRYGDADVLTASGVLERVRPWQHYYSICAQRKL
jgi:Amidase